MSKRLEKSSADTLTSSPAFGKLKLYHLLQLLKGYPDAEDETETKFLQYILCYPSGWSVTSPKHHEDALVH